MRSAVAADIRSIFNAPDQQEAEHLLGKVLERYRKNSPGHPLDLDVTGRTVFQKTTAGMRAALSALSNVVHYFAPVFYAGATAKCLRSLGAEPTFVVSGDDNGKAAEDMAAARFIDAPIADLTPRPSSRGLKSPRPITA